MLKSKLFQYAVIYNPTKEDETPKIIVEPTTVIGKSENSVSMKAIREIPEEYMDKFEDIEVVVRPF